LTLPGGKDPADFLAEQGAEEFQRLIDGAAELWEHKLKLTFERYGFDSPKAREDIVSEMVGLMAQAPRLSGTPREHLLLSRLSQRVGFSEQMVRQQLAEARKQAAKRPVSPVRVDSSQRTVKGTAGQFELSKSDRIETALLEVVFSDPASLGAIRAQVALEEIGNEALRKLLQLCYELSEQGREASYERLMAVLEDPEQKRLAQRIDELARSKEIGRKLREIERPTESAIGRSYLDQVIENLRWQRDERSHETAKGKIAQQLSAGEREGDRKAQLEALSQVQAFHAKRAAQQRTN
jgi:DNA primase